MPAIPAIIYAGASIYAAHVAAKGNKDAAKTEAASNDKALEQAKTIYDTQRGDQMPYRTSGYGALNALNYGLGLPAVPAMAQPPVAASGPASTTQTPASTGGLSSLGGSSVTPTKIGYTTGTLAGGGGSVKVKAPNGLVYLVPNDRAAEAQKQGGVLV